MEEQWRDVKGYEGIYLVSNHGRIKNLKLDLILKAHECKGRGLKPYLKVGLRKPKHRGRYRVHRLVANHFIPNPNNLPEVNHKDGNTLNNKVSNLEWTSRVNNMKHALKKGLIKSGENSASSTLTNEQVFNVRQDYMNGKKRKEIAKEYNIKYSNVGSIVRIDKWKYVKLPKGYKEFLKGGK